VFFFSAGMSTGMIASLIIVFFILARFLPKVRTHFTAMLNRYWVFLQRVAGISFRDEVRSVMGRGFSYQGHLTNKQTLTDHLTPQTSRTKGLAHHSNSL